MCADQVQCIGQAERLSHRRGESTCSQSVVLLQAVVAMCPCHTFNISDNATYLLQPQPAG